MFKSYYTQNVNVICNGIEACKAAQIYATNISNHAIIDCVSVTSCLSMYITLKNNAYIIIACYDSNARDHMHILTNDDINTKWKLYSGCVAEFEGTIVGEDDGAMNGEV